MAVRARTPEGKRMHPRGATAKRLELWRAGTRFWYGVTPEFFGLSDCSHASGDGEGWPAAACSNECVAAQLEGVRRWLREELGTAGQATPLAIRAAARRRDQGAMARRAAAGKLAQAIELLTDAPDGARVNARALGVLRAELRCLDAAAMRHSHEAPRAGGRGGRPRNSFADMVELLRDTLACAGRRGVGVPEGVDVGVTEAVRFFYHDMSGGPLEVKDFLEDEIQRASKQSARRTSASKQSARRTSASKQSARRTKP